MDAQTNKADLLSFLGNKLYHDYFEMATFEHGGSTSNPVGGVCASASVSADDDVNQACALESLVDTLLLEASMEFEHAQEDENNIKDEHKLASRFATPKTSEDVAMAIATRVPKKTQTDTRYCVELWKKNGVHLGMLS